MKRLICLTILGCFVVGCETELQKAINPLKLVFVGEILPVGENSRRPKQCVPGLGGDPNSCKCHRALGHPELCFDPGYAPTSRKARKSPRG